LRGALHDLAVRVYLFPNSDQRRSSRLRLFKPDLVGSVWGCLATADRITIDRCACTCAGRNADSSAAEFHGAYTAASHFNSASSSASTSGGECCELDCTCSATQHDFGAAEPGHSGAD
jgi:hypothetical protein